MDDVYFVEQCTKAARSVLTAWANKIICYEVSGKKQFCLEADHSWGTAYCDWSIHKYALIEALQKAGATNISGKVTWNYVRLYFNKK